MNKEHILTVKEACQLLDMSAQTLRVHMELGNLPIGIIIPGKKRNKYVITKELFTKFTGIEFTESKNEKEEN